MKYLTVDGQEYACPFAEVVRPHTALEYANLEASILKHRRINCEIQWYISSKWGHTFIDGHSRTEIGLKHDIPIPIGPAGFHRGISDADAEEMARSLNVDRRHLSPEEQQQLRAERIPRVAAARISGKTLRDIAAEEQISHEQVRQDLLTAEGSGLLPSTPGREDRKKGKPRRKRTLQSRGLMHTRSVFTIARKIYGQVERRERFRLIAAQHGCPIEELSDGGLSWPALDAIAAVLQDMSPGATA